MVVEALSTAWRAWADLGASLDEQQWAHPTRLDGWKVKHIYAHHSGFPRVAAEVSALPPAEAALTHADATELLADLQRPGGAADTLADSLREHAIKHADEHSTAELVAQFRDVAPATIAHLRELDLTRRVDYGGRAIVSEGEGLRIFLLEAVVHYLDIATALDLPVPGPMAGEPLQRTVRLLTELADPVSLIDLATGRGTPKVFPVLR
jgi:uncharacterized protein (TIGR03083 family)